MMHHNTDLINALAQTSEHRAIFLDYSLLTAETSYRASNRREAWLSQLKENSNLFLTPNVVKCMYPQLKGVESVSYTDSLRKRNELSPFHKRSKEKFILTFEEEGNIFRLPSSYWEQPKVQEIVTNLTRYGVKPAHLALVLSAKEWKRNNPDDTVAIFAHTGKIAYAHKVINGESSQNGIDYVRIERSSIDSFVGSRL